MSVRDLRWQDIEALAVLERELFPSDAWTAQTWWSELALRPRRDYAVDIDGAGIAAYGGIDDGGEVADVMTLAVAPRARGIGRGDAMLEELVARARSRGAERLMLEVRVDNAPALGLYSRHGFERLTVRRRYYQPGNIDAHVMRLTLRDRTARG